jgi:biopolymer transport protein ExbB/TolQ
MPLLENALYELSQLFLLPVLIVIVGLFCHAFVALGAFALEAWQRRRPAYVSRLSAQRRARPELALPDLELVVLRTLEPLRLNTRTAPMLGLVATMIPMGPALLSLADGTGKGIADHLAVAFTAVIIALIAASLSFFVLTVRRRWLLTELRNIERDELAESQAQDSPAPGSAAPIMLHVAGG